MPTHRVGASSYATRVYHGGDRSVHSGGAANTAGTSYGLNFSRKGPYPVSSWRKVHSYFFGELTIVPPSLTRGLVSWVELETPIILTRGLVSWLEFELPLVPTRGRVSWNELEVPFKPTRGRISWLEFEAPIALTRGRVSWVEIEVPLRLTRGLVSWSELQIPNPPTRGLISFVEFETPSLGATSSHWNANSGFSAMTGGGDIEEDQ